MRVFHILPGSVHESSGLPMVLPAKGYVWIACARREFELEQGAVQSTLQVLCGMTLVDLHTADLLNNQLPSHYDYTSQYDILVFRRLAAGHSETDLAQPGAVLTQATKRGGPPVLRRIDTSPVGFAVFDRVLLTVRSAPDLRGQCGLTGRRHPPAAQSGRPDAAHRQPDGGRLPGASARAHAPARPLANRIAQSERPLHQLGLIAGRAHLAAPARPGL
jgi:hypothetical protein